MSSMHSSTEQGIRNLPGPIVARLKAIVRRVRRMQLIKGGCATAATALVAALAVMGIDAAFAVDHKAVRLALSLTALAVTLLVLWTRLIRPLFRRISLTAVARWVETHHPEMQERLSTAVELTRYPDAGSSELLSMVVREAIDDAGRLDPKTELSNRIARRPVIVAACATVMMLAVLLIWPKITPRLMARLFAPLADIGNAWAGNIRLLELPQVIAEGDPLDIEAAVGGKPERVELRRQMPDGTEVTEVLTADPNVKVREEETGFALRMPSVTGGNFVARLASGKAVTPPFTVAVLPRPAPESLTVKLEYPAHTGMAAETKTDFTGDITGPEGTKVEVRGRLNRPVVKAEVLLDGAPAEGVTTVTENGVPFVEWRTTLTPGMDTLWHFALVDEHGLTSRLPDMGIRAAKDLPPVITLETPVDSEFEMRPTDRLPLRYVVEEDFGISALKVNVRPSGKPGSAVPLEIPARNPQDARFWQGAAVLSLAGLPLEGADEFRFDLEVADTLPAVSGGPQIARSREVLIRIRRDAKPLMQQTFAAQAEEVRQEIEQARQLVQEARQKIQDKPGRLEHEDRMPPDLLKDVEQSQQSAEKAAAMLEEIAEKMKDTAYARQAEDLKQIAGQLVTPAAENAEDIPLTDDRAKRAELAKQATAKLEEALNQLNDEQYQLQEEQRQAENVARLEALADEQAQLAREAAEERRRTAEKAAVEARELAEKAKDLARKQEAAMQMAAQADTPDKQQEVARAEQQAAEEMEKFREQAEQFQRQNAGELNQDAVRRQRVEQARQDTKEARENARDAERLAQHAADQNRQQPQPPPVPDREQAQRAAVRARELAQKAAELGKKQGELAAQASQADTEEKQQQWSETERQASREAEELAQQMQQFQNENGGALGRDAADRQLSEQAAQDARSAQKNTEQAAELAGEAAKQSRDEAAATGEEKQPEGAPNAGSDEARAAAMEAQAAQKELAAAAESLEKLAGNLSEDAAAEQASTQPQPQGQDEAAASRQEAQAAHQEMTKTADSLEELAAQLAQEAGTTAPNELAPASPGQREKAMQAAREAQRKWQHEQNKVAGQAQDLAQQMAQQNSEEQQRAVQEASSRAAELAAEAGELAAAQSALTEKVAAVQETDEQRQALAQEESAIAQKAEALRQKAQDLAKEASPQIDQSAAAQESAAKAGSELAESVEEARQAGEHLAAAKSQEKEEASGAKSPAEQTAQEANNASGESPPSGSTPEPSSEEGQGAETAAHNEKPGSPENESGQPDASSTAEDSASPKIAGEAPAETGASKTDATAHSAARAAGGSLTAAAKALESLSGALTAEARSLAEESKAMEQGKQQSQQAAREGSEQGPNNAEASAGNAQESAQNAAEALARAAEAAAESMGIPQSARENAQNRPNPGKGNGKGKGKPQQPGGEGGTPRAGPQPAGAGMEMPPELAKLGMTTADWAKLRGVLGGAGSADSDRVPAEYRDLVRQYFGALSKGEDTGEEGKRK